MATNINALDTEIEGKVYLNPEQRSSISREINQLEWAINGKSMYDGEAAGDIRVGGHAPEPELAREHQQTLVQMLDHGTPPTTTPAEKNHLYRRMKKLEADIQDGMPTVKQMREATSVNVDHHMAWESHNMSNILKWRQIRRILDPDNDAASFTNIESFRPDPKDGSIHVNSEKFKAGYDLIKWSNKLEDSLEDDVVDDQMYLSFLQLHARDWSRKSVIRELGVDGRLYELMLARFNESNPTNPEDDEYEGEVSNELVDHQEASHEPQAENWLMLALQEVGVSKSKLARDSGVNSLTINKVLEGKDVVRSSVVKIEGQLKAYKISNTRRANIAKKKEEAHTAPSEELSEAPSEALSEVTVEA